MSGGPLSVFHAGLRLLGDELAFALGTAVRRLEIRRLEKRLSEEYACLGRLGQTEADQAEAGFCRMQAAFLAEEAGRVEREIQARQEARQRAKTGAQH